MKKRPLCVVAALLIILLVLCPKSHWLKEPVLEDRGKLEFSGTVKTREQRSDKTLYYLTGCKDSSNTSIDSILVYDTQEGSSYPVGSQISIFGTIYQLQKPTNPGGFDANLYYQTQGILYTCNASNVSLLKTGERFSIKEWLTCRKEEMGVTLDLIYQEKDAGLLRAILLGDKSALDEETKNLYQRNGISHVLAISGLHISMIGLALYRLLRKLGAGFIQAGIPSGLFLILYCVLTGVSVSSVRAVCMFCVFAGADMAGRTYDMCSAMSLAAIIILLHNPLWLYNTSYLFSFGAIFAISVVYPVFHKCFPVKLKLFKTLELSISIALVTMPVTLWCYYSYPLYGIGLNLIVIPLMSLVMIFGILSLFAGFMSITVGKILGMVCHEIFALYECLGRKAMTLPGAVVRTGKPSGYIMICYYITLVIILWLLYKGYAKCAGAVMIASISCILMIPAHKGFLFTMLDVGQGDGLFLRTQSDTVILIDGGSTSEKNVGQYTLLPYLNYEGVSKIDYVVISHGDKDHISGIMEVMEDSKSPGGISIGKLLLPARNVEDENIDMLYKLAKECEICVDTIEQGNKIMDEETEIICLYPDKAGMSAQERNDGSTVLKVNYQNISMLFTGDLGEAGERELLEEGVLSHCTLWKVSHHGSKYSGTNPFLKQISPLVSLVSAGKYNTYGHPNPALLQRIDDVGSLYYTTIESGAICVRSDGTGLEVETYVND